MKGGPATGPSPVDRGKAGSKHHVIVEAHGIPVAAVTTGRNRDDVTQLLPMIQAVAPIRGRISPPGRFCPCPGFRPYGVKGAMPARTKREQLSRCP
ncbi:hypothetical protein ACWGIV_07355 [Streptomyces sp. NPDC054844]